ncbi:MAG: helix-turn-helix transcriptional regulator [Pseudomonadota bacterium]
MADLDTEPTLSASEVDRLVGERIRRRRILMGLTQDQLGETLGISYQQIQKYETGANRVSAGRLYLIAKCLDVSPGWFFDPVQSDRGQADLDELGSSRLLIDFVRSFSRIEDEKLKSVLVTLVRTMAETDSSTSLDIAPSAENPAHPQ